MYCDGVQCAAVCCVHADVLEAVRLLGDSLKFPAQVLEYTHNQPAWLKCVHEEISFKGIKLGCEVDQQLKRLACRTNWSVGLEVPMRYSVHNSQAQNTAQHKLLTISCSRSKV
jgi:hypothetical protein